MNSYDAVTVWRHRAGRPTTAAKSTRSPQGERQQKNITITVRTSDEKQRTMKELSCSLECPHFTPQLKTEETSREYQQLEHDNTSNVQNNVQQLEHKDNFTAAEN